MRYADGICILYTCIFIHVNHCIVECVFFFKINITINNTYTDFFNATNTFLLLYRKF